MGPITVVLRMTGLLLLVPQAHPAGSEVGTLPLHVLVPAEGSSVRPHMAQFGWRSSQADCKHHFQRIKQNQGICWADMTNWFMELGQGGTPTSGMILPPSGAVPLGGSQHRASPALLGDSPGQQVRASVTLFSGRAVEECPFAEWDFRGHTGVAFSNVVTWTLQLPAMPAIKHRPLNAPGGAEEALDGPAAVNDTLELFIRDMPTEEVNPGPMPPSEPEAGVTQATDFNAIYDLLNVPAGERELPVFRRKTGRVCKFERSPGSPTCMVGGGLPQP